MKSGLDYNVIIAFKNRTLKLGVLLLNILLLLLLVFLLRWFNYSI